MLCNDDNARVAIPPGVYYSEAHDNFYDTMTLRGKGTPFWETWKFASHLFPQIPLEE